jgi:hypothetical protein
MILAVGVVLILLDRARQPGALGWLDALVAPADVGTGNAIDSRLAAAAPRESADGFVIPKTQPGEKTDQPSTPASGTRFFPGVKPEWFTVIRDNTPSSQAEQSCTLPLLDILQRTDLDKLRAASVGRITYAQLFRQPGEYRGQLVTISGTIRAAHRVELPKNEYGIREYRQVWLYPIDNRFQPIVVYCLDLPKGFPTGDKVSEQGELTGFFLKRWAYSAKNDMYVAPTILAKTLDWQRRPIARQAEPVDLGWIAFAIAVAAVLAMLTAWLIYVRTRPTPPASPDRPLDPDALRLMDEENLKDAP